MNEAVRALTGESTPAENKFFESGGEQVEGELVELNRSREPEPEQQREPPEAKRVPLPELIAERKRRQELEAALAEMRQEVARRDGELSALKKPVEQKQPEKPVPGVDEDPVAHFKAEIDALKSQLTQAQEKILGREKSEEQRQVEQRVIDMTAKAAQDFRQTGNEGQPVSDYDDAITFAVNAYNGMLIAQGMPPQVAEQRTSADLMNFFYRQLVNGNNPAQSAYQVAKAMGFQSKTAPAPKVEPRVDASSDLTKRLDQLEKGVKAARGSGSSGAAVDSEPSLKELADMDFSDPEASRLWERLIGPSR